MGSLEGIDSEDMCNRIETSVKIILQLGIFHHPPNTLRIHEIILNMKDLFQPLSHFPYCNIETNCYHLLTLYFPNGLS